MSGIRNKLANMLLTEVEILLKEATNSESWGPSASQLREINKASYSRENYNKILPFIVTRVEDKNYYVVNKTLVVIRHLLEGGTPQFSHDFKDYQYIFRGVLKHSFHDEDGNDRTQVSTL